MASSPRGASLPAPAAAERPAGTGPTGLRWPLAETLGTLHQRFREDRLGITASSLTFTTLIALVPLFTLMLALFTAFPMFGSLQEALERYLVKSLVPANIARPVLESLTQFASRANTLGAAGLAALLVTALALMLTIDRTLNAIWRVKTPRPIAQRVLVYWAAMTLGPLVLGSSLTLTSYALSASRGLVETMPGSIAVTLRLVDFSLFALAMTGLFRYVPNTRVRWRHAMAGGVFVAVAMEAAKRLLAFYVASVPIYASVYGAFATVPILLLWIYVAWVIVLLGAVVAAYAPSLRIGAARRSVGEGRCFALALSVLSELRRARTDDRRGLGVDSLGVALRIDPLELEAPVEALAALGWIGRLEEEGEQRFVLLCDPALTPAAPLVDRLLLAPLAEVAAFRRASGIERMTLSRLLDADPSATTPGGVPSE